jgi:hypothetical protein
VAAPGHSLEPLRPSSWPPRTGAGRLVPTGIRKSPLSRAATTGDTSANRGLRPTTSASCPLLPCAFLVLTEAYRESADDARSRGWPVRRSGAASILRP